MTPAPLADLHTLRAETADIARHVAQHLARIDSVIATVGGRLPTRRLLDGQSLRLRRRALDLTLAQLASEVDGLTKSGIGAVERGASKSADSIARIDRALSRLEQERSHA